MCAGGEARATAGPETSATSSARLAWRLALARSQEPELPQARLSPEPQLARLSPELPHLALRTAPAWRVLPQSALLQDLALLQEPGLHRVLVPHLA